MKNKIISIMVLILLVCMPCAFAQISNLPNAKAHSRFLHEISMEEFMLLGGLTYDNIGQYAGKACVKSNVPPLLINPDAKIYGLTDLNDLELPDYGFKFDKSFIGARQQRMDDIVKMMDDAFNDPAVQDYKVLTDPALQYTSYGLYFTAVVDSMTFGNDAIKLIGEITNSAYDGALWVNYGYVTSNADVKVAFDDYTEFNLLFNGLMNQIESSSELEETVDYTAEVLGSQMNNQAGHNNIFQAHEQIGVAGNSFESAQGYFQAGDILDAAGNTPLAQRLDFMGMMNMAQAFYSLGEAYKLKQMVLFMLLDGTFKNNMKMKEKLGTYLGPPCDEIPNICPAPPSTVGSCCKGCPPAIYILDSSYLPCLGGGITKGTPGFFPTPGGSPGPSTIPPTGRAIAALTNDNYDIFARVNIPVFDKDKVPELSSWQVPKFPEVPAEVSPDQQLVLGENMDSLRIAEDVLFKLNVPDGEIMMPNILEGKHYLLDGIPVVINSAGKLVNVNTGEVLQDLGIEVGQKKEQFDLAEKRLEKLKQVAEFEEEIKPLAGAAANKYLQARRDELLTTLSFVDLVYKQELRNLDAKDTSFKERHGSLALLYQKVADDLISVMEKEISDERVKKFAYLFPEHETVLKDLMNVRKNTDELVKSNEEIIQIIFDDSIALYYKAIKESR